MKADITDKYKRIRSYQLGIWATGQEQAVTPVFLPASTGRLDTLDKREIARLLPCPPQHLEVVISPFSVLFGTEHHIVCAYDAGPNGLLRPSGPEPGIPFSNAPGDLCSHAVHMTRSLVHSFGSQINGNAIFFYLKRGKHFLANTDFHAVKAFIEAWDEGDASCTRSALKQFAKAFHTTLKEKEEKVKMKMHDPDRSLQIEEFDVAIFPALDEKPFVIKHPFDKVPPEDNYRSFHRLISEEAILGDGSTELLTIGRMFGEPRSLENKLRIHIRSFLAREEGFCPINLSIERSTNRTAVHNWSGNIIVIRERSGGSELVEDITDQDIDTAITYFSLYGRYNL
ncbi:hypothetical protein Clacol_004131 [Clathrus columnatus]|uniref:Uncharacterized protein n=1 Tax=Clathrus columnatus TaxID=1419009 RepID=A0AAV5A8B5_9AGAM|nr:hypothetical protein Clacol_004131 [Clathrus columnatus]